MPCFKFLWISIDSRLHLGVHVAKCRHKLRTVRILSHRPRRLYKLRLIQIYFALVRSLRRSWEIPRDWRSSKMKVILKLRADPPMTEMNRPWNYWRSFRLTLLRFASNKELFVFSGLGGSSCFDLKAYEFSLQDQIEKLCHQVHENSSFPKLNIIKYKYWQKGFGCFLEASPR